MRILCVEDEAELRGAVARRLRAVGHAVDEVGSVADARRQLKVHRYELVILDRGLPDGDGVGLLRQLRGDGPAVLILTALDAVPHRVEGLDAGAEDYVVKPFDMDELLARVAVIARRGPGELPQRTQVADVALDHRRAEVRRGGVRLTLRAKEFAVLAHLCRHPGRPASQEQLLAACWDEAHEPGSNVVEVTVSSLRRKLGDPPLIDTRRGFGYVVEG